MAKQVKTTNPGVTGSQALVIPITNIYDGNDYSAQLLVGSNKTPVNVILDTGSSTLAVTPTAYLAKNDTDLQATTLAQLILYGTGGWCGPVVTTTITMGNNTASVTLQNASIAITDVQQQNNFGGVDGIMGLAYNALNIAYDFKDYLTQTHPAAPKTYPWPFKAGGHFTIFTNKFKQLLAKQNVPHTEVIPYFTQLDEQGVVANKFAFYTKRSGVHVATEDMKQVADDPLNTGLFILGGGEEQTDLYTGDFIDVDVKDDLYYNTSLIAVQVAGGDRVEISPLKDADASIGSNSIIDSGTSILALSSEVYGAIIAALQKLNPSFITLINTADASGLPMTQLNLAEWPNINFILGGITNNEVTLTCTPSTYWQVNYPKPGIATFQVSGSQAEANLSIFGLPLMNNYYTVFDRSTNKNGIVRFAAIK
jgi:hypothetical protein